MRLILFVLIAGMAAVLGFFAYQMNTSEPRSVAAAAPPAPPPPVMVSFIVAARPLSLGTLARPEDFAAKTVTADKVPSGALVDTPESRLNLRGAYIRRYLEAGAAITAGDFMRPRERGYLSAVLLPGTRAVSIGVNAVSGVAGLISPGDSVDVILTQELQQAPGRSGRTFTSETILSNVRILAVDQDIAQGSSASGGRPAATVTVQASADEAERLAVAGRLGSLSLAVRSADATREPVGRSVSGADVSAAFARSGMAPPPGTKVEIVQGDKRSEVTFR